MRTSLIVNVNKYLENLTTIKAKLKTNTKFLAVVKADAYGHGAVALANASSEVGVDYFGVATVAEAVELREAGISTPILILTEPTDLGLLDGVLYYNITLTVYSREFIDKLNNVASKFQKKAKVHLKVDTGMTRVGVETSEAIAYVKHINKCKFLELEGMFTHLSDADNADVSYTAEQIKKFDVVLADLKKQKINIPIIHAANSAATLNHPQAHYDMVRVGIALYKEVLTFRARVLFVRSIKKGTSVGYSRTFVANNDMQLAVISVGYADGYSRHLSNTGQVIIKGKICNIIGNVCMDMIIVELPKGLKVVIGDEATLIGKDQKEQITATDIAQKTGTIDYEVMCSIGKRVPRLYSLSNSKSSR